MSTHEHEHECTRCHKTWHCDGCNEAGESRICYECIVAPSTPPSPHEMAVTYYTVDLPMRPRKAFEAGVETERTRAEKQEQALRKERDIARQELDAMRTYVDIDRLIRERDEAEDAFNVLKTEIARTRAVLSSYSC